MTRSLLLLSALALGAPSFAQAPTNQAPINTMHDHPAPMNMPMNMTGSARDGSLNPLETLSGRAFDRAYLSMMIPHHEAGALMSEALLARSRDPRVRAWAREVIVAQRNEVREMTALLRDEHLTPDGAMQATMTREMRPMIDEVKSSPNPDEAWVRLMLGHHALGIGMATLALQQADADRVRLSAQGIVRVQAQQMYEYRRWTPGT